MRSDLQAFVIGNVTIDETVLIDALPSAGASIHGRSSHYDLGGKGANQAMVISRCGLRTTLVAAVGNDARASLIRAELRGEALESRLIELTGKASDASIILRLPSGENANITTTDSAGNLQLQSVLPHIATAKPSHFAVLQGNLAPDTTLCVLQHAKAIGMITAFNPSPLRQTFDTLWPLVDIAFLNEGEAFALTKLAGETAARWLLDRGVTQVILTLGSKGALLVNAKETVLVSASACAVVDTTGAGDTFMGVALASAALRKSAIDRLSLYHAAQAAALTVSRTGTRSAFPSVEEMSEIFSGPLYP